MLTDFYVFEPPPREVPFSDEAAEVRDERAKAVAAGLPLLVLLRPRMVHGEGLTREDLRCPEWHDEADCLVLLDRDNRFKVLKGAV